MSIETETIDEIYVAIANTYAVTSNCIFTVDFGLTRQIAISANLFAKTTYVSSIPNQRSLGAEIGCRPILFLRTPFHEW